MESDWIWDRLEPLERQVAELLVEGKSNTAICSEVYLSRARVQECIKRIQIKTGTDGTRAAIALLAGEKESQTLLWALEQAKSGIGIIQDRLLKFANSALGDILGYDPKEIEGRPLVELLGPRRRDAVVKRYDMTIRGGAYVGTHVITAMSKDGQEKEIVVDSGGLVQYRGRPAVLAIARSLETEEGETQALLRILDEASVGVAILQDNIVKFANRTFHDVHGYTPAELDGRPVADLIDSGSLDFVKKQRKKILDGEPFAQSYDVAVLCKGGEYKKATVVRAGHVPYMGRAALLVTFPGERSTESRPKV